MNARQRLRHFFAARRPVLLSVILVTADTAVPDQLRVARDRGADGVFLLGHGIGHQKVLRTARLAAERHPGLFIGVSCPDLRPRDVGCRRASKAYGPPSSESGRGTQTLSRLSAKLAAKACGKSCIGAKSMRRWRRGT